jgi:hypothetical protein
MTDSVILGRVGAHVLDQLEQVLLRIERPGTDVGPGVWPRTVEVAIPFASSDGTDVSPTAIVVGETPIPLAQARELLLPLERLVLVAAADLEHARAASRGLLVLRVLLPQPAAPPPTFDAQID